MLLSRWAPERLRSFEHFSKMMDDMFTNWETPTGMWAPSVDIKETDQEYMITAELPGLERKDVDVEVQGDVLMIHGKREFSKEEKKENYVRLERSYGEFQRSFTLACPVKADKIQADLKNGLLSIKVPKAEKVATHKVPVREA